MSVKRILFVVGGALVTVVIGLAIINRAKNSFPIVKTVIGE